MSDWAAHLGREVSVIGRAEDWKAGAMINSENAPSIWPKGVHEWPEDVGGTIVRVTGTVVERRDLPVFVQEPDEPSLQGIPVPPGTDLHEASRRFKLSNFKIEQVRP